MPKKFKWGVAKIAALTGDCSVQVRTFKKGNLSDDAMGSVGRIANGALDRVKTVLGYLDNAGSDGKIRGAVDAAAQKYYKCERLTGADLDLVKICLTKIQNGLTNGAAGIKIHDFLTTYTDKAKTYGYVKRREEKPGDDPKKLVKHPYNDTTVKRGDIHLTRQLLQPDQLSHGVLTYIHELSHRYADRQDHASIEIDLLSGEPEKSKSYTKADALSDADSLAWFVVCAYDKAK
jgi:hypothetical protein